ncbi:MAG: hypothetical protein QM756_13890 [Polyangiaceae bacterium]
MQLKARTLHELAEMVTSGSGSGFFGTAQPDNRLSVFKYRSSSELTRFFKTCDTDHVHDGGSRVPWTEEVLSQLNKGMSSRPDLFGRIGDDAGMKCSGPAKCTRAARPAMQAFWLSSRLRLTLT